jgi:uncharacterized protein with HEPN domain
MNENDIVRLRHMLDAAREAVGFMQGLNRNDLDENRLLALAETRLLEIIGEAAREVSQETRDKYSQVSWKLIIGMRDRLIHGYFKVDLNIVWKVIVDDLPPLISTLETIIPSENA